MAQTKKCVTTWQHMDTPHGTHVGMHVCMCACARVCAHVRARMTREIKLPFQDNVISRCHMHLIYVLIFVIFCHVGLCLSTLSAQVTWRYMDRAIRALIDDR